MKDSKRIDNSYPSLDGLRVEDYTPRQTRVSKVSFVICYTSNDTLGMTGIAFARPNGVKVTRMKLTGREKFLLNELMLDFYERRKGKL